MDRLTRRLGEFVYLAKGCCEDTLPAEMKTRDVRATLQRLAAYEDTGFTPEEIIKLKQERDALIEQVPHDPEKQGRWISVNDRMPEDDLPPGSKTKRINVLVAIKSARGYTVRTQTRMRAAEYYILHGYPEWFWRFSAGDVTHWMPIPEPPKEGQS